MTDLRQALGLIVLFGAMAFAYVWLGVPGVAGMGLGLTVFWLCTGIATGYWVGTDATAEAMVTELMRRIRAARASEGQQSRSRG